MSPPRSVTDNRPAAAQPDLTLLHFMVRLGAEMTAAGEGVEQVRRTLMQVADVNGERAQVVVFPTVLFVELGSGEAARLQLIADFGDGLRFDQIDALYRMIRRAEAGNCTPAEGLDELSRIETMPSTFPWKVRVAGHAVLAVGLTLMLQPTTPGLVGAVLLGLVVGWVKLLRLPSVQVLLPVLVAFSCGLAVLGTIDQISDSEISPLRMVIPPLSTFLPGAAITLGIMELAAGQVMAGSSRLVLGLVQLALLAFGVLAAVQVLNPSHDLADSSANLLGWWAPWLGVVAYAVGVCLHNAATQRSFSWVILVLMAAYAGQVVGASIVGGGLSAFVGAAVMSPLSLAIERHAGVPSRLTFTPAFWMLVPSSLGLIGVATELSSASSGAIDDMGVAFVSIVSVALGILAGRGLYNLGIDWLRRAVVMIEDMA